MFFKKNNDSEICKEQINASIITKVLSVLLRTVNRG